MDASLLPKRRKRTIFGIEQVPVCSDPRNGRSHRRARQPMFAAAQTPAAMLSMLGPKGVHMNISSALGPMASLIAGILILVVPRLLN